MSIQKKIQGKKKQKKANPAEEMHIGGTNFKIYKPSNVLFFPF
jgi:hypothetical protein